MTPGSVTAICISPAAGDPMQMVSEVMAIAGAGLQGDRYASGKGSFNKDTGVGNRQVTFINARFFVGSGFRFDQSRRNILASGVELMWLIGREFQAGEARFRGIKYCDPCSRPARLAGSQISFMNRFSDCGGLVAEVLEGGLVRVDDLIIPPPKRY